CSLATAFGVAELDHKRWFIAGGPFTSREGAGLAGYLTKVWFGGNSSRTAECRRLRDPGTCRGRLLSSLERAAGRFRAQCDSREPRGGFDRSADRPGPGCRSTGV